MNAKYLNAHNFQVSTFPFSVGGHGILGDGTLGAGTLGVIVPPPTLTYTSDMEQELTVLKPGDIIVFTDGPTDTNDTPGSSCEPCPIGQFSLGNAFGQACFDIDECKYTSLNKCPENSDCINTDGSYTCICHNGFQENFLHPWELFRCSNLDECGLGGVCEVESGASCTNTIGSFECSCPSDMKGTGYIGDPCYSANSVSCKELGLENEIELNLQSKSRFQFHTEGEKTIVYRIRFPQVPETTDYTGFFAFGAKDCGEDFINKLGNGKTM